MWRIACRIANPGDIKHGTCDARDFSTVGRRQFLKGGAAVAAAGLTGPFAFLHTKALAQGTALSGTRGASPYGSLHPTRDQATGLELLMLPQGFQYWSMGWTGDRLDDGNVTASGHDGMAIVHESNGLFTLIRNHETFDIARLHNCPCRRGHWPRKVTARTIPTPGITFAITGPWGKGIFGGPGRGWW